MRSSPLFRRLFLTATLNSLAVAVIVAWVTISSMDRIELQREQRNFRGLAAAVLSRISNAEFDLKLLSDEFQRIQAIHPGLELYILDGEGALRFVLGAAAATYTERIDVEPIERYLREGDESLPISFKSLSVRGQNEVFSAVAFEYRGEKHFLVLAPGSASRILTIRNLRENYGFLATLLIVPVIAVLATLVAAYTLRFLASRFATLMQGVQRLTTGDMSARIPDPAQDEIGTIADAFNLMADSLDRSMLELSKRDRIRRELIADISHDLRRPLQLLRLSVDGIFDSSARGQLPAEHLLTPLTSNLDGLQRLLDELFELAKLEGRESPLEFIKLDLGEFLAEVTGRFTPLARARQVTLECEGSELIADVVAQPELLERALGNLLENALRHTDVGGTVVLRLSTDAEFATVSVSDTGHGIAPEGRERLFERFAQGGVQPQNHTGCGLGLAIVRKIVEVHNSAVTVESVVGEGTAFSFKLALKRGQAFLCGLLLISAVSTARAESPLRVVVVEATDPTALSVQELPCAGFKHEQLLGAADFDGDGRDEILSLDQRHLYRTSTVLCTKVEVRHPEIDPHRYVGSIDIDDDGRDELYFLNSDGTELHQIGEIGTKVFSIPAPATGQLTIARPLPNSGPALILVTETELSWLPLLKGKLTWHPARTLDESVRYGGVVRSDGTDSILVAHKRLPEVFVEMNLRGDNTRQTDQNWTLSPFGSAVALRTGDFDGDGEGDLLSELPGILGFWMRASNPSGQLEYPLRSPRELHLNGSVSADIDGDQADELVTIGADGALLRFGLPIAPPFPGVAVSADGIPVGTTDGEGVVALSSSKRPTVVEASASGATARRTVDQRNSVVRLILSNPASMRDDGAAIGNTAPRIGPHVCLGYNQQFAPRDTRWYGTGRLCPPHYAIVGFDDGGTPTNPRRVDCCPLPATDILLTEHTFVAGECPADMVATGLQLTSDNTELASMRCTLINTDRYALSATGTGRYWGSGYSTRSFQLAMPWHELPVGIRYGIGRVNIGSWDGDGCIGPKPGDLVVGGVGGDCRSGLFRRLRYKSQGVGESVLMFPNCSTIENLLDPRSGCGK